MRCLNIGDWNLPGIEVEHMDRIPWIKKSVLNFKSGEKTLRSWYVG